MSKPYFDMTLEELVRERGLLELEIQRRVLGDPRKSVHVGPSEFKWPWEVEQVIAITKS